MVCCVTSVDPVRDPAADLADPAVLRDPLCGAPVGPGPVVEITVLHQGQPARGGPAGGLQLHPALGGRDAARAVSYSFMRMQRNWSSTSVIRLGSAAAYKYLICSAIV